MLRSPTTNRVTLEKFTLGAHGSGSERLSFAGYFTSDKGRYQW